MLKELQPGSDHSSGLLLCHNQFYSRDYREDAEHSDLLCAGQLENMAWLLAERFRGAQLSHKDTFYSSLICNVQQGCRLLQCFDDAEGATFSWAG